MLSLGELQADIAEMEAYLKIERKWKEGRTRLFCCGGPSHYVKGKGGSARHDHYAPRRNRANAFCGDYARIRLHKLREELEFRIAARQYSRRL